MKEPATSSTRGCGVVLTQDLPDAIYSLQVRAVMYTTKKLAVAASCMPAVVCRCLANRFM